MWVAIVIIAAILFFIIGGVAYMVWERRNEGGPSELQDGHEQGGEATGSEQAGSGGDGGQGQP